MKKNILLLKIIYPVFISAISSYAIPPDTTDVINQSNLVYKIILIGDAGEPAKDIKEPVLKALKTEASINPDSTLVIFLGDNIYSNGCLLYTSPSPRDISGSRMPSSA